MRIVILVCCLSSFFVSEVHSVEPISKARSFAIGISSPHKPDYFHNEWSRGIFLHGSISWLLLPNIRADITGQINGFTYDSDDALGGGIVLADVGGEVNLHLLPVNWRISPFVMVGTAPTFARIGEVVTKDMIDPDDPFSGEPSYFWDIGMMLKYGGGVSVFLGQETHAWITWREQRYHSFIWGKDQFAFRTVLVGIYFFVD
jgi:hypothetical protein